MKKSIIILLAVLLIGFGLFTFSTGELNGSANFKNFSSAVRAYLVNKEMISPHSKTMYQTKSADALLLLLPDNNKPTKSDSDFVRGWKNVASEEGFHLDLMTDSDFLNGSENHYKGIILPDTIHKEIGPELYTKLINYVSSGGSLMLVYDAGIQTENSSAAEKLPLMSTFLGIPCEKEEGKKDCRLENSTVGSNLKALASLGLAPGKCILSTAQTKDPAGPFCAISSYDYGALEYSHFVLNPRDNTPLLLTTADNQLIAAVQPFGQGKLLFINLPITYLWSQTDAVFLHLFLNYFASNMLHLPRLAPVPNGIGGLILNLHTESIDALAGFAILQKIGLFNQGPYSIDFTAGPGLSEPNDHLGMDVLNNKNTQNWMRYLAQLGNAIGSDGGWMHDYYALNASETNEAEFKKYLKMNNEAIEKILGKKVLEYMPPNGNQPAWATRFLEQEGFLGYYTTANIGTAPTQNFINGVLDKDDLWSFPVLVFGENAAIRDFGTNKVPPELVTQWLIESTNFVATQHTSRLIYFHPTDILFFPQYVNSLQIWLGYTQQLRNKGLFQWYTMVDLARFLNSRKKVDWTIEDKGDTQIFKASHPTSLINQTWLVNKIDCDKPVITKGNATIKENEALWIVQAGNEQSLEFNCKKNSTEKQSLTNTYQEKRP